MCRACAGECDGRVTIADLPDGAKSKYEEGKRAVLFTMMNLFSCVEYCFVKICFLNKIQRAP